ncbi:MAG: hypothetical protein E7545_08345 [Ruminococcaceae bacterium]|nr:hypothetical protein [Oscillospiraceae bacterium]
MIKNNKKYTYAILWIDFVDEENEDYNFKIVKFKNVRTNSEKYFLKKYHEFEDAHIEYWYEWDKCRKFGLNGQLTLFDLKKNCLDDRRSWIYEERIVDLEDYKPIIYNTR